MKIGEPEISPSGPGQAWGASWLIDAPWAHPIWGQYLLLLYDLTTPSGRGGRCEDHEVIRYLPGATHEFVLHALGPKTPVDVTKPWSEQRMTTAVLQGPNHGYQIVASNDLEAESRLQAVVDRINRRTLSPDTDYRSDWDRLFADGHSLVVSAFPPTSAIH